MQIADNHNTEKRLLKYWAQLYSSQLKEKENYQKLKPVISIIITDYNLPQFSSEPAHSKWQILETINRQKLLTNDLELHIIMLPRALKEGSNTALHNWLMFLDNPNSLEVQKMVKENKNIEKAMDKLETISGDEHARFIAHLREKARLDEASALEWATETGLAEGLDKGKKEKQIEIAKKMLKKDLDISLIIELTELSKEEILNLK